MTEAGRPTLYDRLRSALSIPSGRGDMSEDELMRELQSRLKPMSTPLTFGELEVGQQFISFPLDGDDSGHGGFRGTSYVFVKVDERERSGPASLVDNAIRLSGGSRGCRSNFPLRERVLRVE